MNDVQQAPALALITEPVKLLATVRVHDPAASLPNAVVMHGAIENCEDCYEARRDADALIVATEWDEFRNPDFDEMKRLMKSPVVFDGRNIYDPESMKEHGFIYFGVGRK